MPTAPLSEQSTRRLDRLAAELDRIETAVVAATRCGSLVPSTDMVFRALNDASVVSAAVIDAHGSKPIPLDVRNGLLRLHCSVTDLVTSLRLYSALGLPLNPTARNWTMSRRDHAPSQLH
jgi:hypothetical protein